MACSFESDNIRTCRPPKVDSNATTAFEMCVLKACKIDLSIPAKAIQRLGTMSPAFARLSSLPVPTSPSSSTLLCEVCQNLALMSLTSRRADEKSRMVHSLVERMCFQDSCNCCTKVQNNSLSTTWALPGDASQRRAKLVRCARLAFFAPETGFIAGLSYKSKNKAMMCDTLKELQAKG